MNFLYAGTNDRLICLNPTNFALKKIDEICSRLYPLYNLWLRDLAHIDGVITLSSDLKTSLLALVDASSIKNLERKEVMKFMAS